jgi:uncharacterized membrane protein YbhN (UPF0104 family)
MPIAPEAEVDEAPLKPSKRSFKSIAITVARIVFTLAVIAGVVYTTVTQWSEVKGYIHELSWPALGASLVMALVGLVAGVFAWRAALSAVGHRVSTRTASQIYLIGLLAKYLPGSVWAFVLQMELGKRAHLPRARAFLASIITVGLGITASLAFSVFGLPALAEVGNWAMVLLLVIVPAAIICAHPRVLTFLVEKLLRLLRRNPLGMRITWRGVGSVLVWSAVSAVANGVHLWLLASGTAAPGFGGLLRCIGAIALGMTIGLFAFLVPSGLGVREAIIVATLLPYVPSPGVALGMALASRLIFVLADLISGVFAGSLALKDMRARAAARSTEPVTDAA